MSRRRTFSCAPDAGKVPRATYPLRSPEATGGSYHDYFVPTVTVRRFRPLARRLFNTARPLRVFIRARKPWRRFLRIRLG